MLKQRKVNGQSVSHQLVTSSENLVASTQFLVALATSESQFRALNQFNFYFPLSQIHYHNLRQRKTKITGNLV